VIADLGLLKAGSDLESTAASFAGGIEAKTNKDGLLEVAYTGGDPEMPVKIVNSYISKLGDFINSRSLNATFQTIDPAVAPADLISKGRTMQKLLISALASAFVGIVLAFVIDYFKKMPFKSV
jgi:capsular polysaccharide biosynthesis protein